MAKLNTKTSVVDYLKSQGKDSSYSARKELAASMGISNYSGTANQNTQMLKQLQSGKSTTKNTTNQNKNTKTNTNTNNTAKTKTTTTKNLNGVDDATTKKATSAFTQSSAVTERDKTADKAMSNLAAVTSQKEIISGDIWDALNAKFVVPSAVTEADAYLKNQLEIIQSGKTSYTDQIKDMMSQIQNREKFSYDVDTDPLFQQALSSAMNSGKQAMQDTIGQASALTGGYGSTYATSVGNQAYNAFIEDAYNNLPQYYQMAMESYQMEGDEMYRQLGMLTDADATEYNRNVTAYDATYQHRNQMYNEAYTQFRDYKSDAFNMANLQLSEHGQKVSDAYNYYSAASNYADSLYAREFDKWNAEVNQAMQYAGMLNSDWWNQTNFDEGVRQYEKNFAENVRQFDTTFAEDVRQFDTTFAENQRQFNENLAEQKRQHNEQMSYNYTALNKKSSSGGSGGSGGSGKGYSLSTTEINALKKAHSDAGGGEKGIEAAMNLLNAMGKAPQNEAEADVVYNVLGTGSATTDSKSGVDWTNATIIKTEDTVNGVLGMGNWFGHVDSNDKYNVNGKEYYAKDIEAAMKDDGIPQATIDKLIKDINKLKKDGTYTYKK